MWQTLDRRQMLAVLGAGAAATALGACRASPAAAESFPVRFSDEQWRQRLSPAAYRVLRQEATKRPFSSPLDREKRPGIFRCGGCGQPLFSSRTKFDSGTGWPSFYAPLRHAVGTRRDFSLGIPRTEVHCARCGAYQAARNCSATPFMQ